MNQSKKQHLFKCLGSGSSLEAKNPSSKADIYTSMPKSLTSLKNTTTFNGSFGHNGNGSVVCPTHDEKSEILYDKEKYKVTLDLSTYKPEDISTEITDNYILVICKESGTGNGEPGTAFLRKFPLPADIASDSINATLSPNGLLVFEARRPKLCGGAKHLLDAKEGCCKSIEKKLIRVRRASSIPTQELDFSDTSDTEA